MRKSLKRNKLMKHSLTLFYTGEGGATVFGDQLLLRNSCTYGIDTFPKYQKWKFWTKFEFEIFTPIPLGGGTKIMIFLKIGRRA